MTMVDEILAIKVCFTNGTLITWSKWNPTTTMTVDMEQSKWYFRVMAPMAIRWWQDNDNGSDDPAIGKLPIRQQEQDFFELFGDWFNAKRSPSVWSCEPFPFISWSFWRIWKQKCNKFINRLKLIRVIPNLYLSKNCYFY